MYVTQCLNNPKMAFLSCWSDDNGHTSACLCMKEGRMPRIRYKHIKNDDIFHNTTMDKALQMERDQQEYWFPPNKNLRIDDCLKENKNGYFRTVTYSDNRDKTFVSCTRPGTEGAIGAVHTADLYKNFSSTAANEAIDYGDYNYIPKEYTDLSRFSEEERNRIFGPYTHTILQHGRTHPFCIEACMFVLAFVMFLAILFFAASFRNITAVVRRNKRKTLKEAALEEDKKPLLLYEID